MTPVSDLALHAQAVRYFMGLAPSLTGTGMLCFIKMGPQPEDPPTTLTRHATGGTTPASKDEKQCGG